MRRKGEKTTSSAAHSFWRQVKGKLPRHYFSLSWHEAEAGAGRAGGGDGGLLLGACVSRSAWDSLARRWEEHVFLILSMAGLDRSIQNRHSESSRLKLRPLTSRHSLHSLARWGCAGAHVCVNVWVIIIHPTLSTFQSQAITRVSGNVLN